MCNLYHLTQKRDDVAKRFNALNKVAGANFGENVYPGYPGAVVVDGELRQMTWGFPLVLKGKDGQPLKPKPVNNARTDKLDSFFWRSSFEKRRCLIPVTKWAEAEGAKGAKTRTWMALPDTDVFACAGVWRGSDEWGDSYSMVMTDADGAASEVHSRMPVLLAKDDWQAWTEGEPEDARKLCRAWTGELVVDRTQDPWTRSAQKSLL